MGTFDNYDELAKGIVHTTYELAERSKHNPVDIPHLFFVLINQASNAISDLLKQGGANLAVVKDTTKKSLSGLLAMQDDLSISQELNDIFEEANIVAQKMGDKNVSIYHIFLSLLQSKNTLSTSLNQQGITFEKMQSIIAQMPKAKLHADNQISSLDNTFQEGEMMNKYSEDLTQLAKDGKLKEVIGREKELKKVIEILCRKEKNNVVILGDSGVGKTAVAELLAQKIVAGEVPEFFKDKQILRVNLGEIVAGTKFRGEFEEKISGIIKTVKASNGKIILFIDEFHNVAGAGKAEGSMGLSEMLKPELSSGNIQVIGATTTSEYRLHIEKDTALTRRFETITVQEPSIQDTITILRGIEGKFEKHHEVTIHDSTIIAAVELSDRYIKDRKLPDKAINVLDQAATKVKIAMTSMPENISDMMTKIGQLTRESISISEEIDTTNDKIIKDESQKKLQSLNQQIATLQSSYDSKKAVREQMKKIFEENKKLESQVQELENQDKSLKEKSEPEKKSEVCHKKISEIQKKITANKQQIISLQSQSGIVIKNTVKKEDIAQVIAEKTGIPITKMAEEESEKLAKLEEYLSTKVIGQEDAIITISNAIRRARIGLKDPKKPIGSFIFLGPTGVGKTELAKALAEFLFFDKKAMVRLNMSEYKEEHSTAKLIGSPPGYIGYEQGGQLTEAIRRKPYSVILLDEVEKAHQSVFDLFLQVFDDGMLNDSLGNTIDFKNTIIIMTSNIGSREIMEKLQGSIETIGDLYPVEGSVEEKKDVGEYTQKHTRNRRSKKKHTEDTPSDKPSVIDELKEELQPILMDFFRPELLNRLDGNIVFNPISPEMLKNILEIKIKEQCELVYASNKITLHFSNQAKNFLAKKGRDPANGARPINRALQNYIIDPLSKEIVAGNIVSGDTVTIDIHEGKIAFDK